MAMLVRRVDATEAHAIVPALVALAVRSKASWGYDDAFMTAFRRSMEGMAVAPQGDVHPLVIVVAEIDETIVGFASVQDEGDRAWLEDLWIEPDRFGHGIGRALWTAALDTARAMGRTTLEFEADPNAVPFYERMGADVFGERPSTLAAGRMLPLMRAAVPPDRPPEAQP